MAVIESSTATATGAVGLTALLVGSYGQVAADVMLVVISALAGCVIALSALKERRVMQSILFVFIGVSVALIASWALTDFVATYAKPLYGPYTPSIIAMFIGFLSNRMPKILDSVLEFLVAQLKKRFAGKDQPDNEQK